MADTEKPTPSEPDHLSTQERAYFESRGEKPIPGEPDPSTSGTEESVEAAPEPVAAEPAEEREAAPQRSQVDHAALQQERTRRKEAQAKARELELLNARMEERFRAMAEAWAPRPQQQAPQRPPDPNQDIFGAVQDL